MNTDNNHYTKALRFNWLTKHYDKIVSLTTRERLFKSKLIEHSNLSNVHTLLDVGSGTGTLAISIKKAYEKIQVTGLDGDPNIISLATNKANKCNIDINFKQGLSYELPFENNKFERCLSSLFFHHLTAENKSKTFKEIYRVVKKGGQIHIADWGKPTNLFMRILFYLIQILDGFKTTQDNVKGLLPDLIKQAGFINVEIKEEIPTMLGTMTIYSAFKEL